MSKEYIIYKFEAWERYGERIHNGIIFANNTEVAEIRAKQECEIRGIECPIIYIREAT